MKNVLRILKISKPLYGLIALIIILIIIRSIFEQVTPVVFSYIVEDIRLQITQGNGDIDRVILLLITAFIALGITTVLTSIGNRLGDHFSGKIRKFLTMKFYNKVFTLPQTYFDGEISGKIVHQLNRGILSIKDFMNNATNFMLPSILTSIFTVVILATRSIPIAILIFLLFPIYIALSYQSTRIWGKREVKKNKHEDNTRGRIQEVISNIKLVKGFNNQIEEYKYVNSEQQKVNDIYAKQSRDFHFIDFLRNMSLNIILIAAFGITFYQTFQGVLGIDDMVLIITLIQQARRPLFAMSFILTQIQTAESGSKEYFEILDLESREEYNTDEKLTKVKSASIRFDNVSFEYEKDKEVLHDVDLTIDKNEKVALVGHSGAGKSTIINLILKFYEPSNGDIFINDKKYSDLSHKWVRNNISLVFQDNELFSTTVRDNITYGSDASEEELIGALKKANAYNFVMKFPEKLDTEIGERGIKLSGGQKQRIQIARALLHDAPILILDEATSSLDSKSETLIQEALENLMENKLVIIIAHRFSTIQNVDKIVVIDEGKIVDQGDPKELSQKKGIYSELLRYQVEGNKKLLKNYELF